MAAAPTALWEFWESRAIEVSHDRKMGGRDPKEVGRKAVS